MKEILKYDAVSLSCYKKGDRNTAVFKVAELRREMIWLWGFLESVFGQHQQDGIIFLCLIHISFRQCKQFSGPVEICASRITKLQLRQALHFDAICMKDLLLVGKVPDLEIL